MASGPISQNVGTTPLEDGQNYKSALGFLTVLFFMWGFLTCMNDILIPHLKSLFNMGYTQAMLIQFTFFGAYAIMSVPASFIIGKIGYQKGIVLGLTIASVGAFLFYPASIVISYGMFLFAFFTLATGITVLQVAANPYVAILGTPETASGRLTLTQAFNALGTTVAPIIGAVLILGGTFFVINPENVSTVDATQSTISINDEGWSSYEDKTFIDDKNIENYASDESGQLWFYGSSKLHQFNGEEMHTFNTEGAGLTDAIKGIYEENKTEAKIINESGFDAFQQSRAKLVQIPYIGLGLILLIIAVVFLVIKLPVITTARPSEKTKGSVFKFSHLTLGAIAIFVYVGAEVSIGSFLVSFFGENSIAGLNESQAAKYVALYWGGAMIGRFQGAISMSGITNKVKKYLLMVAVMIFGYFVALYITESHEQASIYGIFIIINLIASLLGKNKAPRTLALFAAAALVFVLLTITTSGYMALWSIIAVGLFNSLMFPTIFTLAINELGEFTSQGSGILNTAIVGGALVPLLMGVLADTIGIQNSFIIALVCYAYILYYALYGSKVKTSVV